MYAIRSYYGRHEKTQGNGKTCIEQRQFESGNNEMVAFVSFLDPVGRCDTGQKKEQKDLEPAAKGYGT